jgi:mannose-6-phosphate isomerase
LVSSPSPVASPVEAAAALSRPAAWLLESCFPFWADRAAHPLGGFRERLTVEGRPLDEELSRVRVQARQTLVFARAALLGWRPALSRSLVQIGVDCLLGPCRRADGLVGRVVRHGAGLADMQPELYDNAFAMMALAWAARALDASELIAEADLMFDQLDLSHAHPAGGFHETLPPRSPRRQNPHMHLFEASLALYAASGAERHAARAAGLLALFETRFLDQALGCIHEHLSDRLEPILTPGGVLIEPGHAFEWIALIDTLGRLTGTATPDYVANLYDSSLRTLDVQGAVPMLAACSGPGADSSRRIWAQTEALRAHLVRATAGDAAAAERARRQLDQIFASHLDPAPAGGWVDHVDADGRPLVDSMTAATGYHLVTAFAEAAEHPATRGDGPDVCRGAAA